MKSLAQFSAFVLAPLLMAATCNQPGPVGPSGVGGSVGSGGNVGLGGVIAGAAGTTPLSVAELTCMHLRDLGCPEAQQVLTCAEQIATIQALGPVASIDLGCLLRAASVATVRACKSVPCGGQ